MYRAEYENDEFEILLADNDEDAIAEAFTLESEKGILFNVVLIDEDYDEIKTIY